MATPPKSSDSTTPPTTPGPQPPDKSPRRPITVIDFGKPQSRQRIKRLRKGKGKLIARVESIVDELVANKAMADTASQAVVVIVVREKADNILSQIL
jgi:hypothetical protein